MNTIIVSVLTLGLMGLTFSLVLAFLSKKLTVKNDPLIEAVINILPGLNCAACGFTGCQAFAQAMVEQKKLFGGCPPGGEKVAGEITKVLDISESPGAQKLTAACRCGAEEGEKKVSQTYQGPQTCKAAHITGGAIDCLYGCIGLGDCLAVCPTKAISLSAKKRIYIDAAKCIGCGRCIAACPRGLFELIPLKENTSIYYVACNNKEKGKDVRGVCAKGCIGCSICTKVADSAFYIKENLAYLNYEKAQEQPGREAAAKCPTKCILKILYL